VVGARSGWRSLWKVRDCSSPSYECGADGSTFDKNGCVREICYSDEECDANERCGYINGNEGGAPGEPEACVSPFTCGVNDSGNCACGGPAVCAGYCVAR
jgi:hypothetical protein